jgi:integrase/recombinase XerD
MVTLRLRFVVSDKDRHGNVRYYFRRRGENKIRLHGLPGSKEFIDAYQKALSGLEKKIPVVGRFARPGSFWAYLHSVLLKCNFREIERQNSNLATTCS